jgi:ketosteroid isomerase-like protein
MTSRRLALFSATGAVLGGAACAQLTVVTARSELLAQVRAAEEDFAATMARRDQAAFTSFLAEDAVFINGGNPLRGRTAITEFWKKFFVLPDAPFSWRPELVEVASSGTLGYTEGPVLSPTGVVFAKFFTTWQRSSGGRWLVVFDNGYSVCKA